MSGQEIRFGIRLKFDGSEAGKIRPVAVEFDRLGSTGAQAGQRIAGGMRDAEAHTDKFSGAVKRATNVAAGLIGINLGAGMVRDLVHVADTATNIQSRLKLVSDTQAALNANMEATFGIAQRTRQSWELTADTYGRLARSGADLDLSQRQLATITETINQAVLVSGGSAESSRAALVQLGQGMASGTLRGEELNSVMEQTPRLAKALADGLGVGIGELRAMGEAGEITGQKIVEALQKSSAAVAADFANMTPTVAGSWQQLSNEAVRYIGAADKASGGSRALAESIQYVAGHLDAFAAAAAVTASVGLGALVGKQAQVVAGAIAVAAAEREKSAATAANTAALLANLNTTQAAIVAARADAAAKLASAHAAATSAQAQIAAARAAGAHSFAIATLAQGEQALAGAMRARSAATAELALLGQQQARVAAAITAATSAQTAAQVASSGAMVAARGVLATLGGPVGLVTTALLAGASAWAIFGSSAEEAGQKSATALMRLRQNALERGRDEADDMRAEAERIKGLQAAALREYSAASSPSDKRAVWKRLDMGGLSEARALIETELGKIEEREKNHAAKIAGMSTSDAWQKAHLAPVEMKRQAVAELDKLYVTEAAKFRGNQQKQLTLAAEYQAKLAVILSKGDKNAAAALEAAAKRAGGEEAAALNKILGLSSDYQKELRAIQRLRDDGRISAEEHSVAVQKLYLTETEGGKAAAKQAADDAKIRQQSIDGIIDRLNKQAMSEADAADAVTAYARGLEEQGALREKELALIGASETYRAVALDQYRIELDLKKQIAAITANILDLDKRAAEIARATSAADAAKSQAAHYQTMKVEQERWKRFGDDIERSLTDGIYRGLEQGGKDGAKVARDTIINSFKAIPIKLAVQAVVEPVMAAGRSVLASTPGTGNLLGITSNASSIYSAYNGAGGYAAQAGAWLDGIIGTTGSVSQGAMLMAQTAAFEGSQAAMLLAQTEAFGEAGAALTAEAAGVGAGMAEGFMAAIPGWGWAGMAALALFGDDLFGSKGGPKTEGTYTEFGADYQVRNGALNQTAADFARSAEAAYDAVARIYGLADASLRSYAEISADPAGDAMTQLGLVLERAGQIVYDRSAEHGGTENVGRSDADMKAAMADAVSEAVLYAVARADGMPAAVEALFDTFESGIADLSVERSSALAAALTGGWLDDLLTTLDESALGLSGVADAAAGMLQKLPVLAQQTGLTADAIGQAFNQALTESAGATEAGQMFAELAADSVYNAMQGQYAQSITNVVMAEIVNPMLLALATGGNVAELLASGIVSDAVERAQQLASAYSSLMSSPEFTAAMNALQGVLSSVGSTAWVPDYNAQASRAATAAADAAESAARAAEDAARAMLAAQTSLVNAQISLIQGLQSAAADWRALSTGLDQDMLRLSRLDPAFDAVGHYTDQITGLLGDWHSLVTAGRDPDSLSYQSEQVALAEQIHRAAMDRYDAELEALERSVAATREMAQSSLDLRRYVEGLRTGDLSPLTMGQKLAEAASNYQSTLARAQGGDMDARAQLSSVSDTYLKLSQGYYAGASTDYSEIFRAVTSSIDGLAQPTRSTEELLSDIRTADATYNTAALDIARRAQSDLAVIKSVTDARLAEVNASVIALGGSLRGYLATRPDVATNTTIPDAVYTSMGQTAPVVASVSNPDGLPAYNAINMSHDQMRDIIAQSGIADGQTLYREIVRNRLDPYAVGAAYGLDRAGMDVWLADQQVVRVPGFEAGGDHAGGLRIVGERGIELEATGPSRIWSADDTRRILAGGGQDNTAVTAKLQVLIEEVQRLRTDNERLAEMVAQVTARSNEDAATTVSAAVERSQRIRQPRAGSVLL